MKRLWLLGALFSGVISAFAAEPRQFFFPHGHAGRTLVMEDLGLLMTAASWTRGDGVEFFDIRGEKPEYLGGTISAGYLTDALRCGDRAYLATGYGVMVVDLQSRRLLDNILLEFPEGRVNSLAVTNDTLFVSTAAGTRTFSIINKPPTQRALPHKEALEKYPWLEKLHIIHNEAPALLCENYALSIDTSSTNMVLFGFNLKEKSPRYERLLVWPRVKKEWYFDIVIPPYALAEAPRDRGFVFAPGALLDLRKPRKASVVTNFEQVASCVRFDADGRRAYLALGNAIEVYDISKIRSPRLERRITSEKVKLFSDFEIDETRIYVNDRRAMHVFEKSGELLSTLDYGENGDYYRLLKVGDYLYALPYRGDDIPALILRGETITPWNALRGAAPILGAQVYKNELYVATPRRIIRYDVTSDPLAPREIASFAGKDSAMQGYYGLDIKDGAILARKYPRFDYWASAESSGEKYAESPRLEVIPAAEKSYLFKNLPPFGSAAPKVKKALPDGRVVVADGFMGIHFEGQTPRGLGSFSSYGSYVYDFAFSAPKTLWLAAGEIGVLEAEIIGGEINILRDIPQMRWRWGHINSVALENGELYVHDTALGTVRIARAQSADAADNP